MNDEIVSIMENVDRLDAGGQVAEANAEDYVGSNPTHPIMILQSFQASKGKADELSTLVSQNLDKNRRCVLSSVDGEGTKSEREPIDKPHCSRYAGMDDKLQSSSVEQPENQSAEIISQLKRELGTPGILQSSEVTHTPITSADTAGGTILPPIPTCTPSAVTPNHKENRIIKN